MVRLYMISRFLRKHKLLTTLIFAVGCFLFFCNKVFAVTYNDTTNNHIYYMNDTYYNWIQSAHDGQNNFIPYNADYDFVTWAFTYQGSIRYNVLFIPANTLSYIIDYNSSTNSFTINPELFNSSNSFTIYYSNDISNLSNLSSTTLNHVNYFNPNGWFGQNNVRIPTTDSNGIYLYGSYKSTILHSGGYLFPSPFTEPTLAGGSSTITVTTELGGISVYGGSIPPTDSMTIKFYSGYNNTNIDNLIDSYVLNSNSGWFVNVQPDDAVSHPGESYFYITNRFMNNPLNNVNGNNYTIELTYPSPNGTAIKTCFITFNLSADVQQNIQDNVQQDTLKQAEQTNAFLNSDKIDDSDIDLPEIEADDFTFSFFSTAVTSIVDAMNSATSNESITIQFRGKTYTINSSDFNFLRNNGFTLLRDLLPILWIFSIGFMIYKDAHYRIQKLKEFNWHAMFTDDIQVDML